MLNNSNYGHLFLILVLGISLILLPVPFELLYDDEVIYYEVAENLAVGEGLLSSTDSGPFFNRAVLPYLIVMPSLYVWKHIFMARLVSGIFSIGCAILIYHIVKNQFERRTALTGSLLFLFSFQTLRFGSRFLMDHFGVFFFLLTIYLLMIKRPGFAGISAILSVLARDLWLPFYPFYILYAMKRGENIKRFIYASIIPIVPFLLWVTFNYGIETFVQKSAGGNAFFILINLRDLGEGVIGNFVYLVSRGWVEFSVIHFLTVVGVLYALLKKESKDIEILFIPQLIIVSFVPGFISNGALTQYPMGLQASLALLAGPGLFMLWENKIKRFFRGNDNIFIPLILCILVVQFLTLNYFVTSWSLRGAQGIHDFGYKHDREIIQLLNENAEGEVIMGIHGAFVKGAEGWGWKERKVAEAVDSEPDWYITNPYLVNLKKNPDDLPEVEVYRIGPYIIFHSHPRGHLYEIIEPAELMKWKYRK